MRMHDLDDLITLNEMWLLSGMKAKNSVYQWTLSPDFPEPKIRKGRNVQLWSRAEFVKWLDFKPNKSRRLRERVITLDADDDFTRSLNA
jgi:predicted DNA-binding transcriptional regulator AlpA